MFSLMGEPSGSNDGLLKDVNPCRGKMDPMKWAETVNAVIGRCCVHIVPLQLCVFFSMVCAATL